MPVKLRAACVSHQRGMVVEVAYGGSVWWYAIHERVRVLAGDSDGDGGSATSSVCRLGLGVRDRVRFRG